MRVDIDLTVGRLCIEDDVWGKQYDSLWSNYMELSDDLDRIAI